MVKAIVIGAGVIGSSVAFRLAQSGAQVVVLERDRVGGGTSGTSFAWTNARNKPPLAYHRLNVAGMQAHADLREEFGSTPWWHGGGGLEWVAEDERAAQTKNVNQLREWGYAAEWLSAAQVREIEPDIDPATVNGAQVAYFPDEGWLDPVLYAYAMLSAARRFDAKVIRGAPVTEITMEADRVTGVRTQDGQRHESDIVINCAGRWANDPMQEAGLHLPLAPTVGLLVFTPPVATGLSRVVHTPLVHFRPDGAGRLMVHRDATDETVSLTDSISPTMPQARDLVARTRRILPSIGEVEAEAVRVAVRPIPADHFSAVGPVPRIKGYYLAMTHSGVTMSPFLGRAVAEEIVDGREQAALADFRPARFFN